ncbi:hypothetical protein EG874_16870, partial [Enterococcus faecalis]
QRPVPHGQVAVQIAPKVRQDQARHRAPGEHLLQAHDVIVGQALQQHALHQRRGLLAHLQHHRVRLAGPAGHEDAALRARLQGLQHLEAQVRGDARRGLPRQPPVIVVLVPAAVAVAVDDDLVVA